MARIPGKSGPQVAEEHVQRLIAVLAEYRNKPLPRYHDELNRTVIAASCGFDRKIFQTNVRCAQLLAQADMEDRERSLNALARAGLVREEKAKVDKDRSALEDQNLRVMAENASLKIELERFRRLEQLMTASGRLP